MRAFPLQVLTTVDLPNMGDTVAMAPELAPEIGDLEQVRLAVTVPNGNGDPGAVLTLETAVHRFADAFYPIGTPATVALDTSGVTVVDLLGYHARYLRWRATAGTMGGAAQFQIDVVGVRETRVRYFTLQDLTTVTGNIVQRLQEIFECGPYGRIIAVARWTEVPTAGSVLSIEHSAVRDEASFVVKEGLGGTTVGVTAVKLDGLLRFLRWRASNWSGTGKFSIDLVCREGF